MKGSSTSGSRIAPRFSAARKFQSSSTQDEEISLNIIGAVFKFKSSATIKDLKTMLCNKYGFPENHLEFFLAGQPLMDFQRVVDCGFLECAVDLVFKNIVGMKLFVKLPSSTIEIEGKAEDTIQKVKAMIQAKEKIQPDKFTLVYDGKFLEEDMTLASLRMKNESTLHIIFNPRDVMSVFVKTPGGKIVEFEVKVLYTVSDVKQIVESFMGCSVVDYSLFYEGNELQDFKTLAFYNIEENSTLEVKPSGIQIFVKTWSGKTITLNVTRSNTLREVKEKIFCKVRVPVIRQRIVFSGKRLEDKCSLASYNIQKQSTLYMISLNIIGTVFKLKSSATIKDIKTMLRNKYGFPENHLEFFLAGQPLMDFQRVVDCGFLECAVDLVFKNIVGMKLFVKLPSSTIEIEGKAEDTIQKVKAMIQAKEKIQPDQFTLVYDGKFLEEDMTLASLRMKNESTLYMVSAPKYNLSISVKTPSGETFKFKVKPLFSVSDHNLIYSGNELEDLKTLAFYDIEDESVLEVSPRSLQIFVKVCDGKIITVDVKQSDSVKELKSKIFRKLNVSMMPFDFYKLVFRGEQLDEVRDLASYNIGRGSKLRLVLSSSVIVRD